MRFSFSPALQTNITARNLFEIFLFLFVEWQLWWYGQSLWHCHSCSLNIWQLWSIYWPFLVFLNQLLLKWNLQCVDKNVFFFFLSGWVYQGEALASGISAFIKEPLEPPVWASPWEDGIRKHYWWGPGPHRHWMFWSMIMDLQLPELKIINLCCL